MSGSFYVPLSGDTFRSSPWTTGPWGPDAQHAGPPAALLGRAFEQVFPPGSQVARVTVEILRPVPIADLRVEAEMTRPGRSVRMAEGRLTAAGTPVVLARAWAMRTDELELPAAPRPDPPRPPEEAEAELFGGRARTDYLAAMEWRFVAGSFFETGPATAWLRMRMPLVAGEEPTPLQRVLVAADSASGISAALDFSQWLYVNADLTVYLHRALAGEWVGLDATTVVETAGVGLTSATIHDRGGPIGRSGQSLFVGRRRST